MRGRESASFWNETMLKFLFPQRRVVTVYLKDGHVITFNCKEFTTTKDVTGASYTSYSASGLKGKSFSFCPGSIVAWEVRATYF